MRILSEKQEILLKDERRALSNLQLALVQFGVSSGRSGDDKPIDSTN